MTRWRRPVRPFLSRAQLFHLEGEAESRRALPRTPHDRPADIRIVELLFAARDGDFHALAALIPLMQQHDDDAFWGEASSLLSSAAPASVLRALVPAFASALFETRDDVVQSWIAETLLNSGLLWTVREALRIMAAQTDRTTMFAIPARLSLLLEPAPGPIFNGAQKIADSSDVHGLDDRDFTCDDAPYIDGVMRAYAAKRDAAPLGDDAALAFGVPIDIEALARDTLETIGGAADDERIATVRTILEGYTGFDLARFYDRKAILDRNGAIGALEALFDAVDLTAYPPGRRMFFGRPVPD